MLKLLLSGHARLRRAIAQAKGCTTACCRCSMWSWSSPWASSFLRLALEQTDTRVARGKSVSPAFLFAALLWHEVLAAGSARGKGERAVTGAL